MRPRRAGRAHRRRPITAPTRLVAAPEDFEPADDVWYAMYGFDDDILFTFDRYNDPAREYWRLNRCTGDVESYPALAPGLHNPYMIDTPNGRVLYANDDDFRPQVVDRFDEPGADEARPVLGLPDSSSHSHSSSRPFATFFDFWTSSPSEGLILGAAGLGGLTYGIYTHLGDPEVPALKLSDRLVTAIYYDDTHSLAHEDNGEVHRIDNLTGERELLRADVRYLAYGKDARTFIWQAIGDDAVEPVFLHDLETGEDLQIAVNDFAATSWHRDPDHHDLGEWVHVDDQNTAAAMIGAGNRFVTAVRLDTGEAITVPEHREQRGAFAGHFRLLLADGPEEVEALWDPRTNTLREWYRGPATRHYPLALDGDLVEYFVDDPEGVRAGSLWRVDLATGERTRLITGTDRFPVRVDETRYLSTTTREQLDGPPLDTSSWLIRELRDLAIVDIGAGQSTPIVDSVSGVLGFPDEGLVFIDALGPEPGLWAYPLPYSLARSADLAHHRQVTAPTTRSILATEEAAARQRLAAPE